MINDFRINSNKDGLLETSSKNVANWALAQSAFFQLNHSVCDSLTVINNFTISALLFDLLIKFVDEEQEAVSFGLATWETLFSTAMLDVHSRGRSDEFFNKYLEEIFSGHFVRTKGEKVCFNPWLVLEIYVYFQKCTDAYFLDKKLELNKNIIFIYF